MKEKIEEYIKKLESYRDSCETLINEHHQKATNTFLTQSIIYNSVVKDLKRIIEEENNQEPIEPPTKL